jgi:galactose mutarotase-like enzyme
MSVIENRFNVRREIRQDQGFNVYVLGNQRVEIAVVPELGARIISVRNLRTEREWMWHPRRGRKLFRNPAGDDFANGPLIGVDECLPTIAPCMWKGRALPDHGEVWNCAWNVDRNAWSEGILRTFVDLNLSPLAFERVVELQDNEVRLRYALTNYSGAPEAYLWAFHPLLDMQPGDQVRLPDSTRALLNGANWVDDLDAEVPGRNAKVFASPIVHGTAAIENGRTGDSLEFEWDPSENNTLGVWLTRGGWHGHHHLALEPTNGQPDDLAAAAAQHRCGTISPGASVQWEVVLRLGAAESAADV